MRPVYALAEPQKIDFFQQGHAGSPPDTYAALNWVDKSATAGIAETFLTHLGFTVMNLNNLQALSEFTISPVRVDFPRTDAEPSIYASQDEFGESFYKMSAWGRDFQGKMLSRQLGNLFSLEHSEPKAENMLGFWFGAPACEKVRMLWPHPPSKLPRPEDPVSGVYLSTPYSFPGEINDALKRFSQGLLIGVIPAPEVVDVARRISRAAVDSTDSPEIAVDVDGAISFDLLLLNGNLLMAELYPDGWLDGSIYDADGNLLKRLRKATWDIITSAIRENSYNVRP